jgi:FkbM family methyltransferase
MIGLMVLCLWNNKAPVFDKSSSAASTASLEKSKDSSFVAAVQVPVLLGVSPVDCTNVGPIQPIKTGQMHSIDNVPYLVSFSWWDHRTRGPAFAAGEVLKANGSVEKIQELIQNTSNTEAAFIDVGANVGFMTMYGINIGRPVFAIDPISYNIGNLCEGLKANVERGWAQSNNNFHLFHAAAGPSYQPLINITRPSDKVGFFDQSSLSREAVKQGDVVTEQIPMVTVDSIIPNDMAVGVVKIDVQGHEYGVLSGMRTLLSRDSGYPTHVFYEDNHIMTVDAGYKVGACAQLLQEYGYACKQEGRGDTLCSKF